MMITKKILTTVEEFRLWLDSNKSPVTALDFETTGLEYLSMEFVGFSLCRGSQACYTANPELLKLLAEEVQSGLWLFHNAVFDLKCLRKFCDTEPESIFCTLVGAKLCDENRLAKRAYSLKTLAIEWLGIPCQYVHRYDEVSANVHSEEFYDYAMNDAIWTYQLWKHEMVQLEKENLLYVAQEIEMPFQLVLADMEMNGVLVDLVKVEAFKHECADILIHIESEMLEVFGKEHQITVDLFGQKQYDSPINFRSGKQLAPYIESLGANVEYNNKTGNPMLDSKQIKRMREETPHPFFNLLLKYKKMTKLYTSFLAPAEKFIGSDGRIRPSYGLVTTGRLSCSDPNLQQLPNPKKEPIEFNYREIFIPKPRHLLIKADYSGQELRNLAEVSHDSNMRNAFNRDFDLHLLTATRVFEIEATDLELTDGTPEHEEIVKKYKQKRHQAKNGINFPIVYGATARRIAADNAVPVEEAQRWLDEFDALYPEVPLWKERVKKLLARQKYVTTLMGRRRRFPEYSKYANKWKRMKMERQAANFQIQGFSADQAKIAGIQARKILSKYGGFVILMVHDELVFEVPEKHCEAFAKELKTIMEGCVSLSVPCIVEVTVVENYG